MGRNKRRELGTRAYQNYKPEVLEACLRAIKSKAMSQRKASKHFKIPVSTIKNKLKKKHGNSIGHPTVFSRAEELSFEQHCITLSNFGFPLVPYDLRMIISRYLCKRGVRVSIFKNNIPGIDWVNSFLKRHPNLSVKVSANIKKTRANITADDINEYMDRLEKTLSGIPPSRIYNYDETNLTDDPGQQKVISKRGSKYVEQICNSSKSAISLMFCGNAEGRVIPIYVVYKAESLWTTWTEGGPPNTRYNRTKSGWFDSSTFEDWFEKVFLKEVEGGEPSALIGDNLASHINERVLSLCDTHNIKFVCLPPNTTHIAQPLDIAFFRPMKGAWRELLREWKKTKTCSNYSTLPKDMFPRLLSKLMEQIDTKKEENLKAGICPINRGKLLDRLAENQNNCLDEDLIGEAFLEQIQKERENFIGGSAKPRKKKLQVLPGDSISFEDLQKARDQPGPSNQPKQQKKKKILALSSSSSSSDESLIMDLESGGDSEDVDDCEADDDCEDVGVSKYVGDLDIDKANYNVDDFVIVKFDNNMFPGRIVTISDNSATIDCMEKRSKSWRWPTKKDCIDYEWGDVIRKIKPPILGKRNFFRVPELEDFVQ